ncbi:Uncharacterised protein [Streptococcus pneumoniae]|nr:Uncharacterised protein [Streptococcus pneumoniae]CJD98306.1 Uncharacterised protein [Streptococcus pneumoniae]
MIRPFGAAIRPRIPASCEKFEMLPRAPESIIITIGFLGSWLAIKRFSSFSRAARHSAVTAL